VAFAIPETVSQGGDPDEERGDTRRRGANAHRHAAVRSGVDPRLQRLRESWPISTPRNVSASPTEAGAGGDPAEPVRPLSCCAARSPVEKIVRAPDLLLHFLEELVHMRARRAIAYISMPGCWLESSGKAIEIGEEGEGPTDLGEIAGAQLLSLFDPGWRLFSKFARASR